jgi:translation elongation factor EF-G
MVTTNIYEALEFITTNKENLKNSIISDIKEYVYNVNSSPNIFASYYLEYLPKYVSLLLIKEIPLTLNPEEVMILKEHLFTECSKQLEYFYKDIT